MEGIIGPAGAGSASLIQSSRAPPVKPTTGIPRVSDSISSKDEKEEEDGKFVDRPSILNLDKEAIERVKNLEVNQKIFETRAPAEALGLLGSTIDLTA